MTLPDAAPPGEPALRFAYEREHISRLEAIWARPHDGLGIRDKEALWWAIERLSGSPPAEPETPPPPPKLGDRSTCRSCGGPIEFIGLYWRHVGQTPRHPAEPIPPPDVTPPGPAAVPPDVLARAVGYLNVNRHDGTGNWNIDQNGEVYGRGHHRHCPHRMSPISALAVAVYCYGMDDPREKGADR
jgi:hypothetical protein